MLGNVYEWVEDIYTNTYAGDLEDPLSTEGSLRVFRGGSWSEFARLVRSAGRFAYHPGLRFGLLGFRLARGQGE